VPETHKVRQCRGPGPCAGGGEVMLKMKEGFWRRCPRAVPELKKRCAIIKGV
jgi:hypothetical protein